MKLSKKLYKASNYWFCNNRHKVVQELERMERLVEDMAQGGFVRPDDDTCYRIECRHRALEIVKSWE